MIKIENLVKRYGNIVALDHFNLEIEEGEIFGLLGPNGSGKTTAINCMLALLKYDRGSIRIMGREMTPDNYDVKRQIGIVMQDVAVFDELNVHDNIDYFCSLYIKDKNKRKELVEDAIRFVGLEDYRKTARGAKGVKTLSVTEKTGRLVAIKAVTDDNDLMIINKSGILIRLKVADVRVMGRATQGVRLINLTKKNDTIASVCKVMSASDEEVVEQESLDEFDSDGDNGQQSVSRESENVAFSDSIGMADEPATDDEHNAEQQE